MGNQALQSMLRSRGVQAKPALSEPGDRLEREADEAAEAVLRMAAPALPARDGSAEIPGIQRKVVDNDFHVPCRNSRADAVDTLRKDEAEGIRICRAAAARIQANTAGADPDPAGFAAALLRRFHLDANDPGVRSQWLPLLARRYRIVANAIEQQNHRYNCAEEGVEPSVDCRTRDGLAFTAPGLGETALCDDYWRKDDDFRGGVIPHEWFHMIFEWFGDCAPTINTDSAECYEMFAREMGGTAGATTLIECCKPPEVAGIPDSAPAAGIGALAGELVQRKCAACENAAQPGKPRCAACEEQGKNIQRKPARAVAQPGMSSALPAPGAGAPLPADVRTFFEPRFQRDFGEVRVHTGAHAAASAQSFNALAYTRGRDIVFGEGQYAPGTSAGRRLIAHELAHVVQQNQSAPLGGEPADSPRLSASSGAQPVQRLVRRSLLNGCGAGQNPFAADRRASTLLTNAIVRIDAAQVERPFDAAAPNAAAIGNAMHTAFRLNAGNDDNWNLPAPHFGLPLIRRRLEAARDYIDSVVFTYNCCPVGGVCPATCGTCTATEEAFVCRGETSTITLCPTFFTRGTNQRGRTLAHEVLHITFGFIRDWDQPDRANAHCYAQFTALANDFNSPADFRCH